MGLPEVGDVEALDPHRDLLHPQGRLQELEGLDALDPAVLGAESVLVEGQPGVAEGELVDATLVPALGVPDLDGRPAAVFESLSDRGPRRSGHLAPDDHLRRDRR